MITVRAILSGCGLLVCGAATVLAQDGAKDKPAGASGYRMQKELELGGDGGWDYLACDAESHRLFVTRGSHVMVVDTETGKAVGDIADTAGVHGVALAPGLNRGFTSNGRAGTSTIFDLKTLKPIDTVKTGDNPDAICYEPATKRVFTMNGRSKDTTAIEAESGKVAGTIELGGKPEFAVADGTGKLFVNIEDKSEVVAIDAKALKVVGRWSLAPGDEPSGLAIDPKNHRLFSVCHNKLMIILDSESGKVVGQAAIGEGVDGAAFDVERGLAFSSNGDGTLTIVKEETPDKFSVLENVPTMRGARTITLDPKTHTVYLPTAKFEAQSQPAEGGGRRRPPMVPNSFRLVVVGKPS